MAKPLIHLRRATMDDARLLWAWRNDPSTRRWSFSKAEIPWDDHCQWLAARLSDGDYAIYIAEDARGEPIGQARFSVSGAEAEIHVVVAPERRGRGVGADLISVACARVLSERPEVQQISARVVAGNLASTKAFQKARFERTDMGDSPATTETSWVLRRAALKEAAEASKP